MCSSSPPIAQAAIKLCNLMGQRFLARQLALGVAVAVAPPVAHLVGLLPILLGCGLRLLYQERPINRWLWEQRANTPGLTAALVININAETAHGI